MQLKFKHLLALISLSAVLSACAGTSLRAPAATPAGQLTPYPSATATITPAPTSADTPTPLPSPTPTPITHTVKKGEDLFGIAIRYKVSLQELLDANPDVQPNMMSIGTVLIIPASAASLPIVPPDQLSPTPIVLQFGDPNCLSEANGGAWCFLPVTNTQAFAVENVSAVLRVTDASGNQLPAQVAYPPLNLLVPGGTLPLMAFFPAANGQPLQASAELVSAVPVPQEPARYLALARAEPRVQIAANGLSAKIDVALKLADPNAQASQVWLLAVAYDSAGRIVGLRRWESAPPGDGFPVLPAGGSLQAGLVVYTSGDPIARVEVLSEARP